MATIGGARTTTDGGRTTTSSAFTSGHGAATLSTSMQKVFDNPGGESA
jgi:hypothetical protein